MDGKGYHIFFASKSILEPFPMVPDALNTAIELVVSHPDEATQLLIAVLLILTAATPIAALVVVAYVVRALTLRAKKEEQ